MAYYGSSPRTEERVVARFQVASDEGEIDTLLTFQEFIEINEVRPAGQPAKWLQGRMRLALSDGSPVNMIDTKTFQVLDTNRIVRKVS